MAPAALDLWRLPVIVLLHLSKARVAASQQIASGLVNTERWQAQQRPRVPRQRQPTRGQFRSGQQWRLRAPTGRTASSTQRSAAAPASASPAPRRAAGHGYRPHPGKGQLEVASAEGDAVRGAVHHLAVPGSDQFNGCGRPEADAGGDDVGAVLAERRGPAQPGLPKPGDDQARAVLCCRPGQFVLDVGVQPVADTESDVEGVGGGGEVERHHRRRIDAGDERGRDVDRARRGRQAQLRTNQFGHHIHRYRGGLLEHAPFAVGLRGDVLVVGIDRGLLRAADNQHGGAQHQQRPQRLDFSDGQWPDVMESAYRRQDRGGFGTGMTQHARRGDRQFGHRPTVGQVAEVDDPVRAGASVVGPRNHHVGVGQVEVDCLPGQVIGEWADPRPGFAGEILQPVAVRRIADMRNEFCHHVVSVAQIPLQDPVQARVAEVGERPADPPGDISESGDGGRGQIARFQQSSARQEAQQPDKGRPVQQSIYVGAFFAREVGQWHGDAQRRLRRGDQLGREILGFQFRCVEGRVGDLQHTENLGVRTVDQEILVLLTAQRFRLCLKAVMSRQDLFGLRLGDLGCR